MRFRTLELVEGAREARGLTVVIDVFRAFTVEAYLVRNGAERLFPVGDMNIAYAMKEKDPACVLIGERHGKILPGFDYGNSPSQIEHVDFSGKTVVHTTSAGTQGIANAIHADEILTGSLVNAGAIARYIREKQPEEVSLVCMGLECISPTEEDDLCAEYIQALVEKGGLPGLREKIDDLRRTSGSKFFDPAQQEVFPEADFHLSTQCDIFDFVLKVHPEKDGLYRIEKIVI